MNWWNNWWGAVQGGGEGVIAASFLRFYSLVFLRKDARKESKACLVPRPHYSARPIRFGSRGPSEEVRRFPPVRLGYIAEVNLPRRPGKTPCKDQVRLKRQSVEAYRGFILVFQSFSSL